MVQKTYFKKECFAGVTSSIQSDLYRDSRASETNIFSSVFKQKYIYLLKLPSKSKIDNIWQYLFTQGPKPLIKKKKKKYILCGITDEKQHTFLGYIPKYKRFFFWHKKKKV